MRIFKDRRHSIACEFSPTQLISARAAKNASITASAVRALPPGALAPDLVAANIPGRDAVRAALQETMAKLGGRDRQMAVILPDASFRVVLMELDVLPERPGEADALVRLRLRKSLPFDIAKARVSWQAQKVNGATTVLAAATLATVLEEYESIVREAGYSPGLVLPSVLASLRAVDGKVPTLLIKVDQASTTIVIVNGPAVALIRILDRIPGQRPANPANATMAFAGAPGESSRLAGEVYSSLMFFQDTYGTKVQRVLVGGAMMSAELKTAIEESAGIRVQQLAGAKQPNPASPTEHSVWGAVSGVLM